MNDLDDLLTGSKMLATLKSIHAPLSRARMNFVINGEDVRSYYALHQVSIKSGVKAIAAKFYVVDKAVFVLLASMWEAFCQDLANEAAVTLAEGAPTPASLPESLLKLVTKELKSADVAELAPWELAGEGWRKYLLDRLELANQRRGFAFASPRSDSVDRLFRETTGIVRISDRWASGGISANIRRDSLDRYIERRNAIVHEYEPGSTVEKRDIRGFFALVSTLVQQTDKAVDALLTRVTGRSHLIHPDLLAQKVSTAAGYAAPLAGAVRTSPTSTMTST